MTSLFHTQLEEFLSKKGIELQELIYGPISPTILEKKWLEAFSEKQFADLGVGRYFPRMIRGLPRLFQKDDPSRCAIKKNFSHLPSLLRLGSQRAFYSLYDSFEILKGTKLSVFSWVMNDGWGDLIGGLEAIRVLQERFQELEIRWVVYINASRNPPELHTSCKVHWAKGGIDSEAKMILRTADLILQIPTFCPQTHEIKEILKKIPLSHPVPQWIEVGEYGYLESDWFHPRSGRFSLGLHCLEKGVFIHKSKMASFAELKNECLLLLLFETVSPGPQEVEKYRAENAFYLAYLNTPAGGIVYLQALIKAHEGDEKRIDLCTPDIGWLIQLIEEHQLSQIQGLEELEIYFEGKQHVPIRPNKGKKVRVFCPGVLADEDFRNLMRLSGELVAVRGNQSFSEAISANKVYFYDGRPHAQHFIRDLAALAENRISAHRTALTIFRAMRKTFLHNLPIEERQWVEESYFQEKESLTQLGLEMGLALQDPDAIAGFKKLGRIISEEYNAADFLCHLIQKELCHKMRPDLALSFEAAVEAFTKGEADFKSCFSHLQLEKKDPIWKMRVMNSEESHNVHQHLGKALRQLIELCAQEEIRLKGEEIGQLATAIGGSLAQEAAILNRNLKALMEISKHVSEIAFQIEEGTREL